MERMAQGFQVTTSNPMVGLEGRSQLLGRLATVLREQKEYFPPSNGLPSRPGNIIGDYHDRYTLMSFHLIMIIFYHRLLAQG